MSRLRRSSLFDAPLSTADEFAERLRSEVTRVLDDVAPLRCKRRRQPKPFTRWLSRDAVAAKRRRRKLERRWRRTQLESDRLAYRVACRQANKLINVSRAEFFRSELSAAATCRQRWQIAKKLLHNQHVQSVF